MDVIVDRIEDNYVIVEIEKGNVSKLPLELVPNALEGDVITIAINKDKTKERKNNIEKLMNQVFEKELN